MINQYDGILRKPFLSEHWHKGFGAGMAIWLPAFIPSFSLLTDRVDNALPVAVGIASAVSVIFFSAVVFHHEGFTLEPDKQRYRLYTWILGLHIGKWQPLPLVTHLTIRPYQEGHNLLVATKPTDPVNLGWKATERSWQVLLSVKDSPIGIVAAYATHTEAQRIAVAISRLLHIENVEQPSTSSLD
ncbi:hypothetical protein JAO73_21845 [Hymenobacter sp. BT523]|uniref:hypothetical protein n=1 Tax=Hymenobacter sp. BT523 TaxID=2795725 RepID=UPI0018EA953B|nr:hypothetical protein [Hymenobacter sp. BT523]MBJ6111680.1 hypothetical protein [Hymenobacter sp. BT523]